jgi:hypothetical protein
MEGVSLFARKRFHTKKLAEIQEPCLHGPGPINAARSGCLGLNRIDHSRIDVGARLEGHTSGPAD